jgi:hypothetical protein
MACAKSAISTSAIFTTRFRRRHGFAIARLLIEILGHRMKDRAHALVELAIGKMSTMLGALPKLL